MTDPTPRALLHLVVAASRKLDAEPTGYSAKATEALQSAIDTAVAHPEIALWEVAQAVMEKQYL